MTAQDPPVKVGDVLLGKYTVEKIIGAGGMGVVVAVRHRELGELYAMKFMLAGALENQTAVERFVREARAAARLKSEHVAKVHDVGRLDDGAPYMVMEYLSGQDLEALLSKSGPLKPDVAATYVMQACDAIAEAHDAGIVHRDLKPANLFLTRRANGTPCIKVLDFGISKTLTAEETPSMTRTSAVMGSPYYMSPEQMRSSKNVDHRTDIWALGVILYQLSTGRVPFPGETITEVCSGVLADDPAPIMALLPDVPPEFDVLVRRCLQKRPEQRYSSARELAAALAPVAGPSPGVSALNLPTPPAGVHGTMAIPSVITGPRPPLPSVPQPNLGASQLGASQYGQQQYAQQQQYGQRPPTYNTGPYQSVPGYPQQQPQGYAPVFSATGMAQQTKVAPGRRNGRGHNRSRRPD
ncbi:MAG: serine/threonine-protein kinase [Polyangiaceae bacterium]